MTIPRRVDMSTGAAQAALRPTMLAELPNVGEEPLIPAAAVALRAQKSPHPAFEQHTDEHDEPTVLSPRNRTTRYIDHAHIDDEWNHRNVERCEKHRRAYEPHIDSHRSLSLMPSHKTGLGGLLSEAHQQMAPFAGLIVTAALFAAAALLFHMMAGGNGLNTDLDEFALPGVRVEAIDGSLPLSESQPLAEAGATDESAESNALETQTLEITPEHSSAHSTLPAESTVQSAPPLAATNGDLNTPLGQLSFPQTGTPLALDYSKASDPDLQELPEVAERTDANVSEGINR